MKKQVLAAINSVQIVDGYVGDQINLVTCASLYRRAGKYYISYEESELTGMEGTATTIKIDGKNVFMMRTGKYPSRMLFVEGERHVGVYPTEYGTMTIATYTTRVVNSMTDHGGALQLDYTIEVDNMVNSENHLELLVTPQKKEEEEQ